MERREEERREEERVLTALLDLGEHALLRRLNVLEERLLPLSNVGDGDTIEKTVDSGVNDGDWEDRSSALGARH